MLKGCKRGIELHVGKAKRLEEARQGFCKFLADLRAEYDRVELGTLLLAALDVRSKPGTRRSLKLAMTKGAVPMRRREKAERCKCSCSTELSFACARHATRGQECTKVNDRIRSS